MASAIDICNMALSYARAGRIESFTENSTPALQCQLFYETCRDQVLEDCAWGFATKIVPLQLLDSDVYSVFNWAYVYQYPSDCLKIQRVILPYEAVTQQSSLDTVRVYGFDNNPQPDLNSPVKYEIFDIDGTTVVAANQSDLRVEYTRSIEEVNKFSASFRLALSRLICAHIAVAVAGEEKGSKIARESLSMYRSLINNAIANEMNQRHEPPQESDLVTARY